ncbi:heme exporter protein CcmB [Pseudoxanthobacter sp.]|uniref:heme exporter protein CcmB n=1 Tax=Pseudoxanthobacter sp. TaxID=1925742 RepID=UPI002FE3743A
MRDLAGPLAALYGRDLALGLRSGGGALIGALFFLCVVAMLPFAAGPDLALMARIGPAILWLGALLATLIGLDRLFQADSDDGTLDLLLAGEVPPALVVLAKAAAHWTAGGLPLIAVAPLLGLMLNMAPGAIATTVAALALGTPALTLTGTIGAALAAALRRGGLIVPVLVLPLSVPVLVFGVAASTGTAGTGPFAVLGGLFLATLAGAPLAAAAALKAGEG